MSRQEFSEVKLGLTELVGIPVVSSMPVPDTDPCKTFKRNLKIVLRQIEKFEDAHAVHKFVDYNDNIPFHSDHSKKVTKQPTCFLQVKPLFVTGIITVNPLYQRFRSGDCFSSTPNTKYFRTWGQACNYAL